MVTRDLIREDLEIHEDAALADLTGEGEATSAGRPTLGHGEVWGQG